MSNYKQGLNSEFDRQEHFDKNLMKLLLTGS